MAYSTSTLQPTVKTEMFLSLFMRRGCIKLCVVWLWKGTVFNKQPVAVILVRNKWFILKQLVFWSGSVFRILDIAYSNTGKSVAYVTKVHVRYRLQLSHSWNSPPCRQTHQIPGVTFFCWHTNHVTNATPDNNWVTMVSKATGIRLFLVPRTLMVI